MSKRSAMILAVCVLSLATLSTALVVTGIQAAPGELAGAFSIPWWTVDGGGGTSQGGSYVLSGTTGQPDAGELSGGAYTLNSGFWSGFVQVEAPIVGLVATNDSPTRLGDTTTLTATVSGGDNVTFNWAFGDGDSAVGASVSNVYPSIGQFTAVVTATNSVSTVSASTLVSVTTDQDQRIIYLPMINR